MRSTVWEQFKKITTGPVGVMTLTEGAKKYIFSLLLCAGPLRFYLICYMCGKMSQDKISLSKYTISLGVTRQCYYLQTYYTYIWKTTICVCVLFSPTLSSPSVSCYLLSKSTIQTLSVDCVQTSYERLSLAMFFVVIL